MFLDYSRAVVVRSFKEKKVFSKRNGLLPFKKLKFFISSFFNFNLIFHKKVTPSFLLKNFLLFSNDYKALSKKKKIIFLFIASDRDFFFNSCFSALQQFNFCYYLKWHSLFFYSRYNFLRSKLGSFYPIFVVDFNLLLHEPYFFSNFKLFSLYPRFVFVPLSVNVAGFVNSTWFLDRDSYALPYSLNNPLPFIFFWLKFLLKLFC